MEEHYWSITYRQVYINHCLRDLVMGLWILESVQAGSGFTASENWSEGSR